MGTLKLKRGTTSQRQGFTPALAELVYDSDTKEVYVGDGTTPVSYTHLTLPTNREV